MSDCKVCERCQTEMVEAGAAAERKRLWELIETLLAASDFIVKESYSGDYSRQKYNAARSALVSSARSGDR